MSERRERETIAPRSRLLDPAARLIRYLESRNGILLLTTSTRFEGHPWDVPKTTQLALRIRDHLRKKRKRVTVIDVAKLRIHTCEGNISAKRGNECGVLAAKLPDRAKNPTGQHRCWASINNADDQLYKISRELFRSRAVVFFVSVRWGQANSVYQRLFERLSWIENRTSTLGAGADPPAAQARGRHRRVRAQLERRGGARRRRSRISSGSAGRRPPPLSFCWQYTRDAEEESPRVLPRCRQAVRGVAEGRCPR